MTPTPAVDDPIPPIEPPPAARFRAPAILAMLGRLWAWHLQTIAFDVGHGAGCQCEECLVERQDWRAL